MSNKTIKFATNLIPLIVAGEKTITYRYSDKYLHLTKGDVLDVYDSSDNAKKCQIEILSNDLSTFGALKHDTPGHEKYTSKEHMKQQFIVYYGKSISDDEPILVVKFKLLNVVI